MQGVITIGSVMCCTPTLFSRSGCCVREPDEIPSEYCSHVSYKSGRILFP
jgi:hypothetical protein